MRSMEGRRLFPPQDGRPPGALTLGLRHLLLASARACNEALHLSGWAGAGQPGRGGELVPGLLLRASSGLAACGWAGPALR